MVIFKKKIALRGSSVRSRFSDDHCAARKGLSGTRPGVKRGGEGHTLGRFDIRQLRIKRRLGSHPREYRMPRSAAEARNNGTERTHRFTS